MSDRNTATLYGLDAYAPSEIAARVEDVGVRKARLPLVPLVLLGVLAGGFVGLGALFFTIVASDSTLGFATSRVLGGVCFSLGLVLVSVAGAELFTGNNLLAMAWADGKVATAELARNWAITCSANFVGAVGLATLVVLSGHTDGNDGAIGSTYVRIAAAKCALPITEAFFRAVLCNVLVCMAVWMSMAGRSVVDRAVAIVFPIAAFVAAGFEHSVANMYLIPVALLLKAQGASGADAVTVSAMFANLGVVILGNIVGGSVMVAAVYRLIYRPAGAPAPEATSATRRGTGAGRPRSR